MPNFRTLVAVCTLILAAPAVVAAQQPRAEAVTLATGTSQVKRGTIAGDEAAEYAIVVKAGQKLAVTLKTSNRSSYFNVTAAGAAEALHVGSIKGDSFETTAATDTTYTVQIYLMRNAARRHEKANYSLTLALAR